MEEAEVHQGLWCCCCCWWWWWWVPLKTSCKLLRVLLSAGVGPAWQRLISYTKFGSESWKETLICLLPLQFPDFCVCLLPTCCWQQPPMCHPVPPTDCYFCIISNDYLTFQEARCPPLNCAVILCTPPQTSRCAMLQHSVASNHLSYDGLCHLSLISPITTYLSIQPVTNSGNHSLCYLLIGKLLQTLCLGLRILNCGLALVKCVKGSLWELCDL